MNHIFSLSSKIVDVCKEYTWKNQNTYEENNHVYWQ